MRTLHSTPFEGHRIDITHPRNVV